MKKDQRCPTVNPSKLAPPSRGHTHESLRVVHFGSLTEHCLSHVRWIGKLTHVVEIRVEPCVVEAVAMHLKPE